jgi:type IV pilus assembly protein PilQ
LGLNFALGTLDVLGDLTASLRLFELQGLVKVISSPRILTLHNETAEIIQTTEIPLITSNIQPNGATTPIVNFKPAQLKLSVTPQVTNDGSIIMVVDMTREVPGEVVDTQTNARPVNSRSAKTKVLLKNSQTAVIGGIYQNDSTESESRVPGMAKIPVIGWLFKNKSIDRKRTELLIFLTPRILGQMQSLPTAGSTPALPDSSHQDDLIEQGSANNITVDSALDMGEESGEVQEGEDSNLDAEFEE